MQTVFEVPRFFRGIFALRAAWYLTVGRMSSRLVGLMIAATALLIAFFDGNSFGSILFYWILIALVALVLVVLVTAAVQYGIFRNEGAYHRGVIRALLLPEKLVLVGADGDSRTYPVNSDLDATEFFGYVIIYSENVRMLVAPIEVIPRRWVREIHSQARKVAWTVALTR